MNFDKTYNECKAVIIARMIKMKIFGDAEEYINQAYVELIESKSYITKESLINKSIRVLLNNYSRADNRKSEFSKETTKTCVYCNQNLPINFFGITDSTVHGRRLIQPYCRNCAKEYFKKYVEKDRDKWNTYLKRRYRFHADNLTDEYIKKRLRCYKWETINITPEVIRHYRKQLQQIREKKKQKIDRLPVFSLPSSDY